MDLPRDLRSAPAADAPDPSPPPAPEERLTPGPPPRHQPLAGSRVLLRPLQPAADVDELYAGSHGSADREALWRFLPYGPFAGRADMEMWLEARAAEEDPLFYCAVDRESGRRLGMMSFLRIEPEMRVLEIGHIWYVPEAQRSHVNTEACYLLMRETFDGLGYRRLEWKCDAANERSRRAALRLGFEPEGVLRQHRIVKGRNRDTAWFALLDRDWPRVRENLERWLAAPPGTLSLRQLNQEGVGA